MRFGYSKHGSFLLDEKTQAFRVVSDLRKVTLGSKFYSTTPLIGNFW